MSKITQNSKLNHMPIITQAFGKFILSGEHSVVYGCPALAVATQLTCNVTLLIEDIALHQKDINIKFDLQNYNWQKTFLLHEILDFQTYVQQTLCNKLPQQHDLAIYAISAFANYFKQNMHLNIEHNLTFMVNSQLPINCGMGSSASLIVALGKAFYQYTKQYLRNQNMNLEKEEDVEEFLNLCLKIENIQHGRSSGIDLYLAYHGGGIFFNNNKKESRKNIMNNKKIRLINTGSSLSSTKEVVTKVSDKIHNAELLSNFSSVTSTLDRALNVNNQRLIAECLQYNHQLLCCIDVVPLKVQRFIDDLKQRNMTGKLSGAGTVQGDRAGIVLVYGEGKIDDLLKLYEYQEIQHH